MVLHNGRIKRVKKVAIIAKFDHQGLYNKSTSFSVPKTRVDALTRPSIRFGKPLIDKMRIAHSRRAWIIWNVNCTFNAKSKWIPLFKRQKIWLFFFIVFVEINFNRDDDKCYEKAKQILWFRCVHVSIFLWL